MLWVLNCKHRGKMKGTVELTQKFLGLPFFFNKYNSYDCTSYEKKKKKRREKQWIMESGISHWNTLRLFPPYPQQTLHWGAQSVREEQRRRRKILPVLPAPAGTIHSTKSWFWSRLGGLWSLPAWCGCISRQENRNKAALSCWIVYFSARRAFASGHSPGGWVQCCWQDAQK